MIMKSKNLENMMSVVREENGFMILIPLSVVIAANLFFQEQDCDTLKNLICIPVRKSSLAIAKLLVLLLFMVCYQLTGFGFSIVLAAMLGIPLERVMLELWLTLGSGILLWGAAMPCILLVVWFNKSYIISVIIAFAYMVSGYMLHINDRFVMVPLGVNAATFLPVPMIFRWLYQFHSMEGVGGELLAFYNRFTPYFVPTHMVFAVLMTEAAVCMALLAKIYQKQSV